MASSPTGNNMANNLMASSRTGNNKLMASSHMASHTDSSHTDNSLTEATSKVTSSGQDRLAVHHLLRASQQSRLKLLAPVPHRRWDDGW